MPPQEVLEFSPPGEVSLAGGWVLQAMQAVDAGRFRGEILSNTDPFQAWFDAEALPLPLIVRRRRPGDRIEPLGMQGRTLKISDLMVNIKIPRRLRHGWPLVCTKQDILWVPGCRQSQLVRVTAATRWAVRLVLAESCYNGDADH
jgi:tRNA(Ile)-lysidine synthase